jgi:hypothetical protein
MKGIDMQKKNRNVVRENKNRKNVLKTTVTDKDKNICPRLDLLPAVAIKTPAK